MINRAENDRIFEAARLVTAESEQIGRSLAFAVTDEAAELVFGLRTQRAAARLLVHAVRKAFTAATMQRDTAEFGRQDRERGKSLAEWGDTRLTYLAGGAVLVRDGDYFGGVGVGGGTAEQDHLLAQRIADLLLG